MYSVILMTAMTAGTEAPGFGGGWYNKCTLDMCWPMRYGWVSCGPKVSHYHGCHGACHGCWGGCWGGCYGSCYGCGGYAWPLSYGVYPPIMPYGGYGYFPAGTGIGQATPTDPRLSTPAGTIAPGIVPGTIAPGGIEGLPRPKEEPKRLMIQPASSNRTASITVEVPAGAKVYIDNNLMKSTSARRTFTTPALELNEDYYYWVRVVVEENGKTLEEVKKVIVRAGERSEPQFAFSNRERPAYADAARTTGR